MSGRDSIALWASRAEERACLVIDAAARALDLAAAAETAGVHDLAESLRSAAAEATARANAVDTAVRAFETATIEADGAAETLVYLAGDANAALCTLASGAR